MKKFAFKITIKADKRKVWTTMLNADTYKQWIEPSWPGSTFIGSWKEGQTIRFISRSGEGTQAFLQEVKPYECIKATHNAIVLRDGSEDRNSEMAKGWVGITESYYFTEKNGETEVTVEINTKPAWESMFSDGWPAALAKLKEIVERG